MPAIARSLGLLASLAIGGFAADVHDQVVDLFASMAAALTAVNAPQFMAAFDKNMSGYDKLKDQVDALVNQAEISSSVEPLKDEGDDSKRTVELDWYMEIRSVAQDGPIARRREIVTCELRKEGKRWKIVSLKPVEFFAPAKFE